MSALCHSIQLSKHPRYRNSPFTIFAHQNFLATSRSFKNDPATVAKSALET